MSKKKRFGVSEALTRGLSETIAVVENIQGKFRVASIPLSRIELDPENPRKLLISLTEVKFGLKKDDVHFKQKMQELNDLNLLAKTIKTSGVINSVITYKHSDLYRVVAGERRCLASILAGKTEIESKIYNEKPKGFELRLLQWIENTAREDLRLFERIDNVISMIKAYERENSEKVVNATRLSEMTGLSLTQASYYLTVISAPARIQQMIESGVLNNLDKAVFIAKAQDKPLQDTLINAAMENKTLKEIKQIALAYSQAKLQEKKQTSESRGRTATRVNLGSTKKGFVVKKIIETFMQIPPYNQYANHFSNLNWSDLKITSRAFKEFIQLLETEV